MYQGDRRYSRSRETQTNVSLDVSVVVQEYLEDKPSILTRCMRFVKSDIHARHPEVGRVIDSDRPSSA